MDNNNQTNYAGFWIRWFAQLVDTVIWMVRLFIGLYILSQFGSRNMEAFFPNLLWFLLYIFVSSMITSLISPWLVSKFGAGVGKLACGLEIVRDDGTRLTYKNALFREYVAKVASNALLGLGYYWISRTPKKQAWHDELSGTYVVKKHNGVVAGILTLVLFFAIEVGFAYKAFDNFRSNKTLQYDFAIWISEIQQDTTSNPKTPTPSVTDVYNGN